MGKSKYRRYISASDVTILWDRPVRENKNMQKFISRDFESEYKNKLP
jgi:hypothetical protein